MSVEEKILVLVDGYSSGAQLPEIMKELGWRCIHVCSSEDTSGYFQKTYNPEEYIENFSYTGNLYSLASKIKDLNPSAVLPGSECGVITADALADALHLLGNAPETSLARRNKYEMHNRLKACGVQSLAHFMASDFASLYEWASNGTWPVVIKPVDSAGTDSVHFCKNKDELSSAFHKLIFTKNQLGKRNDYVLAQRFLTGPEYFINGVSGNGKHVITEIWRADKRSGEKGGWIYDRAVLFDPTSPEMSEIVKYAHTVFDALGVQYGATHTELIVTETGPILIECASRLSGGLCRPATNFAVGVSQLDLIANLVAEGTVAIDSIVLNAKKGHKHPLWQVQLISNQEGLVTQSNYEELLKNLKSKAWIQRAPRPGETIIRTVDLLSSPGIIFMSHPETDVLDSDYQTIRDWERNARLVTVE